MRLEILTIVYNGEPFIEWLLPIFQELKCAWTWRIAHGPADNKHCTSWCQPQQSGLSTDGTLEYLSDISKLTRARIYQKELWDGKLQMFNTMLAEIPEPSVILEIDCDEIWKPEAIDKIVSLFEDDDSLGAIKIPCRYFVGPKLVCEGKNCWSNKDSEWLRAFRFEPSMTFLRHEPPKLNGLLGRTMDREESAQHGLTFDHLAYVTEAQVSYKEKFYGYAGVLNQWRALQRNTFWPAKLSRFFSFEMHGDAPMVRKI